ncbi:membrane protein [Flaviramulus aquimarinus]|uniref:Membrane protein n=1 Tax=Flaviramulus aquimarinus TaxID=1170456 RepID=A0ABP9ESF7_9FLAO
MKETSNKHLIIALLIGIVFHGTSIFFTLETTYDALIHLFFADHYANSWFEPWNYKWYTGFTVMSYPPLVHQAIAALSFIGGLKFGLFTVALISIILFITGVYRFSLLITSNKKVAGYASILAVLSSSFVETLHVFGQLPSIIGISVLMHALPEIYLWLKTGKYRYLLTALSLIAVTVTSHHVTPIFGMVFFIFPLIGMVIMDVSSEQVNSIKAVTFKVFLNSFFKLFKRIISFGMLSLVIIIGCILPYWINSKNNPITQVPIPHGSRDNFLEITSSGLVFFLIPWGVLLIFLPYIFYRYYSKRYLFFGFSITILAVLGTGGTTFIPRLFLGETAFNILTLDRFTLWASIMSLPFFGEFVYRFVEGDLKQRIQNKFGAIYHRLIGGLLAGLFLFMTIFTMSLGYFRPSQPQQIKMLPIVNFLNQDQHDQWRYMTLGFGDQMAWLSAQTNAMSVDGNYHSARRLPELTTRPIERLENSKFKGVEGIGSLQQFLTTPEKYNFKYIFSNDKFYDPILYFCGWQRLRQLENGIQVWEKLNVPPISSILPKDDVATWQKILWGITPFLTVIIAFVLNIQMLWIRTLKRTLKTIPDYLKFQNNYTHFSKGLLKITHIWSIILAITVCFGLYRFYIKNDSHHSPENVLLAYYDALDFKAFEKAHQLVNPKSNLPIAQYMLEISVTDGLLSSYAKLDAIETTITSQTDSLATVKVNTKWITPLEKISKTDYKSLTKLNGKWYINPDDVDLDLPPDQLYLDNVTTYFNQGRRRITTEQTHHEDILKQPVLEVLSAKLVKHNSSYALIGEVQNIDNVPADVVLKGTLYNDDNKELATYNAKYHVKHKLMPKEVSTFKINFEGIAWSKTKDSIPKTFNPDEFTPVEFEEQPTKFNLQVAGNVSGSDLYKGITLSDLNISKNHITGKLFNSGIEEVTIPQLLITYYDANKTMLWVDHLFIAKGIRQQRQQSFEYPILQNDTIQLINNDMENCFVNGLPNTSISNKIVPNRIHNQTHSVLQPINHTNYSFVKIEMNTYIGNPN